MLKRIQMEKIRLEEDKNNFIWNIFLFIIFTVDALISSIGASNDVQFLFLQISSNGMMKFFK